jgi:hypothetical protein
MGDGDGLAVALAVGLGDAEALAVALGEGDGLAVEIAAFTSPPITALSVNAASFVPRRAETTASRRIPTTSSASGAVLCLRLAPYRTDPA